MKNKKLRQNAIEEIITNTSVGNQDDLLQVLTEKGFSLTQATLSRDLKEMKIVKHPADNGEYLYKIHSQPSIHYSENRPDSIFIQKGVLSIDFSGNMVVIRTKPGYAAGIASDIDAIRSSLFLGSIAGDDTILIILKEGVNRISVKETLTNIIPDIK